MDKSMSCGAVCALAVSACASAEIIGPWDVQEAPIAAMLIPPGGGPDWGWLNIVDEPVDVNEAFSDFSIIADGYASADEGTVVKITLSVSGVPNLPGFDLVLFEARYGAGEYAISTTPDFAVEVQLLQTDFDDTGVDRVYFYEHGLFPTLADVWAAPIDLSGLDIGDEELVTTLYFRTTNDQADPLGVGILPAPMSILVMGVGAATLFRTRPRRRNR
jgi:hypothetical protein